MILLIATLMLISVALIMVGMRLLRPRFSYFWLIAATAATLAWVIVLAARWLTPDEWPNMIPLVTWEPDFLFPVSPALLLDDISWSFSLVLVTLALAALLTDAGRKPLADRKSTRLNSSH